MKIKKIEWKNVASYGNKIQRLDLPENSGLIQVVGENGSGKCFFPDTQLIIKIPDDPKFIQKISGYLSKKLSHSDM